MNCPGSVALIKELELPDSDEPDYRAEGTAAHEVAARCLEQDIDAWEAIGTPTENDVEVTSEMAEAVQVYLDECRSLIGDASRIYIEHKMFEPDFHDSFFGTVDFAILTVEGDEIVLDVNDYKHGVGVVVEAHWNPQIMYYAYGILLRHPDVTKVRMRIVQPRGFHPEGPIRLFELDAETLRKWATGTLRPAMIRAEVDSHLDAGDHCRFCPAKIVCPLLTSVFRAMATHDPKEEIKTTDQSLGQLYKLIPAAKHFQKALEGEVFRRLTSGLEVAYTKLVYKKANRIYKPGAEAVMKENFAADAFTKPELKSPAEIEKLGNGAKVLIKEWAYTPESGLTVALESDKRVGVKVQSTADTFAKANLGGTDD